MIAEALPRQAFERLLELKRKLQEKEAYYRAKEENRHLNSKER